MKFQTKRKRNKINENIIEFDLDSFINHEHQDSKGHNYDYGNIMSDSDEGLTAKQTLLTMSKDLYTLYTSINDADDLPEWCHYKLATSSKDLSDVSDYLSSKILKHCIDNNISENDLRKIIKNKISESTINEGIGDLYSKFKGLFSKKQELTSISNVIQKSKIEQYYQEGYYGGHLRNFVESILFIEKLNKNLYFMIHKTSKQYDDIIISNGISVLKSLNEFKDFLRSKSLIESRQEISQTDDWQYDIETNFGLFEFNCKEIIKRTEIQKINRIADFFDERKYKSTRIVLAPFNRLIDDTIKMLNSLVSDLSKKTIPVKTKQFIDSKTQSGYALGDEKGIKTQKTLQGYPVVNSSIMGTVNPVIAYKTTVIAMQDENKRKLANNFRSLYLAINELNKKAKLAIIENDMEDKIVKAGDIIRILNDFKQLINDSRLYEAKNKIILKEIENFTKDPKKLSEFKIAAEKIEYFHHRIEKGIEDYKDYFHKLKALFNESGNENLKLILPYFKQLLDQTIENLSIIHYSDGIGKVLYKTK